MGLLTTSQPDLFFEDTQVGRLFKEIWETDEDAVDAILADGPANVYAAGQFTSIGAVPVNRIASLFNQHMIR